MTSPPLHLCTSNQARSPRRSPPALLGPLGASGRRSVVRGARPRCGRALAGRPLQQVALRAGDSERASDSCLGQVQAARARPARRHGRALSRRFRRQRRQERGRLASGRFASWRTCARAHAHKARLLRLLRRLASTLPVRRPVRLCVGFLVRVACRARARIARRPGNTKLARRANRSLASQPASQPKRHQVRANDKKLACRAGGLTKPRAGLSSPAQLTCSSCGARVPKAHRLLAPVCAPVCPCVCVLAGVCARELESDEPSGTSSETCADKR